MTLSLVAIFSRVGMRKESRVRSAPRVISIPVEFRDASWLDAEIYELLRAHGAALFIHDHIKDHPRVRTAEWLYLRFHGGENNGSYSDRQLAEIADHIENSLARL